MLSLEQYHKAFKSYDIRGIWNKEIDDDLWYYLGLGLGKYILNQTGTHATIMIWADTRQNNTQLINNTLSGLSQVGLTEFVSAGMDFEDYPHNICSTAMAYQLSYQTYDYSIIFSASHNSAEYIGIKIFTKENKFIPTSKLKQLFTEAFEQYQAEWFIPLSDSQATNFYQHTQGIITNKKKRSDTLNHYFAQLTKPHSFAIDYGHGAAVAYEQEYINTSLIGHWKLLITNLFTTPDGSFPAHETDTSRFSNYEQLTTVVQENNLDFGFMFDGDADRLGIVLKNGTVMTGDILTAIVAKQALTNGMADAFWSKKIFYEVFSSKVVPETVTAYGGESTMVRVWRWAFCEQVIAEHGLIAGESSAHILFWPYGTSEMPLLALALILKESENFASFDEMAAHYMSTYKSQVSHFAISDKDGLIAHIQDQYSSYPQHTIDGVRIEWPWRWFTVRKSGTEDIVKVAWEADTKEEFEAEYKKLRDIIIEFGGHEE